MDEAFPGGTSTQQAVAMAAAALERLHHHVRGWLGDEGCIRADFAAAVCSTTFGSGEPVWGLLIDPSSGAKTEVIRMGGAVQDAALDEFTSAALLSWSKAKEPRPVGILLRIPAKALITVADFSTILASSDRGLRDQQFADLRRVYDGALNRDLGNMEKPLHWEGRVTMLAASTPAIDEYSSHSDKLGPRWLYFRGAVSTTAGKLAGAGKRITEQQLEANRATARNLFTEAVTYGRTAYPLIRLSDAAIKELGDVAVAATICRSPVPRFGYAPRDITGLPVIEEPYRLAYQLRALACGAMAIGYTEHAAVGLARRCAMDTVPPVRIRMLRVLAPEGAKLTSAVAGRLTQTDRKVARRALEDLRALEITACPVEDETDDEDTAATVMVPGYADDGRLVKMRVAKVWQYSEDPDPDVAEKVRIVRNTMRKLVTSADSVPNSYNTLSCSLSNKESPPSVPSHFSEHSLAVSISAQAGVSPNGYVPDWWPQWYAAADHSAQQA